MVTDMGLLNGDGGMEVRKYGSPKLIIQIR